jgi:hypothetical protein
LQDVSRPGFTGLVRDRVASLHDRDALRRQPVAVAGDHYAFEGRPGGPMPLDREGHGSPCFAGTDDQGPAFGRRWEVPWQYLQRIGGGDGRVETADE